MSNVKKYTDRQILDRVKLVPNFKGFPNGILDVWIRSDEDEFDRFDDKVYTFECFGDERKPQFVMVCTGTSNAGAEGLKRFDKYNRLGCALLKSDTIVYNSHAYGLHKGDPNHPAYRQIKPFPYHRDNDKDNRNEELGGIYSDIIGANCHRAGWFSKEIGGWSVACLVRNQRAQFDAWMRFMNHRPLTVCILREWNPSPQAQENPFQNLREDEISFEFPKNSAAAPATVSATTNPAEVKQGEFDNPATEPSPDNFIFGRNSIENVGEKIGGFIEDQTGAIESTLGKTAETVTETIQTTIGTVEKQTTEIIDKFKPLNLPAFIPRFGKQWFLALVPGGGLLTTILAKAAEMPDWLIYLVGIFTGITLGGIIALGIVHRVLISRFLITCYESLKDPDSNNLIPTPAKEYVGFVSSYGERRAELLSQLNKTPVERLSEAFRALPDSEKKRFISGFDFGERKS